MRPTAIAFEIVLVTRALSCYQCHTMQKFTSATCWLFASLSVPFTALAQLTIDGVTDKGTYNNTVSYRVQMQAGFTYLALLNGQPAPVGTLVTITSPDYYELFVQRTEVATSTVSNRLVRFIVNDSQRLDTEWGLPPQTPFPFIQSSSNEFVGSHLRLLVPQDFPAGYEIPVVGWVENDEGHAVRANAFLTASGHPTIQ